jgi:uncharacterized membrane protein YeaQ/YmgE (transglycosylase-associated protein family)
LNLYVIFWIAFGGLIGWIAAMIESIDSKTTTMSFILIGIIGSLLGGGGLKLLSTTTAINITQDNLFFPILSAVVIIFIALRFRKTIF